MELDNFILFSVNMAWAGVMSENVVMCKIAHFCTFLCVILTNFMHDFLVLTKYKRIDAKIAHFLPK